MGKRKAKRRASERARSNIDLGTDQRGNHGMGIEIGARIVAEGGIVVHEGAKVVAASVLETLLKSNLLLGDQGGTRERQAIARTRYDAGERLMRLFMNAGLNELKAMDPDRSGGGAGAEPSDKAAHARAQFNDVVRRMGPWMDCLTKVVLHDQPPASVETVRNVRRALDHLCEVFRM